jgi:hypothetical protein
MGNLGSSVANGHPYSRWTGSVPSGPSPWQAPTLTVSLMILIVPTVPSRIEITRTNREDVLDRASWIGVR